MRWRLFVHVCAWSSGDFTTSGCDRIDSEARVIFFVLIRRSYQRLASDMAGAGDAAPARVRARLSTLTLGHFLCASLEKRSR